MEAWEYAEVVADHASSGRLYHEFLRVPDLSAGLYVLEAGATDPQSPHTEDELYYVVAGRGMVSVDGETRPVVPGTLVFVPAAVGASVPRHRRAAGAAGRVRSGGGRPRLRAARPAWRASPPSSAAQASDRFVEGQRELRAATDLVVAEEDEHVVAAAQERLEPRSPRLDLARVVVVAAQPDVEERARFGGASAGPRRAGRWRTAPRPRRPARRTSRRRATTGPGTPSSAAGRRATRRASRRACRRRAERRRERGTGRSRADHRRRDTARSATGPRSSGRRRGRGTSRRAGP